MIQLIMARHSVLAFAAATGRVGYVFLVDGVLRDWKISKKASQSPQAAQEYATKWIELFRPNVVITEKIKDESRKGEQAKSLIAAIASVAEQHQLLDVVVERVQAFKNKYEEARALVSHFPDLRPQLPKQPRCWQSEPFSTTYFEALALALVVIDQPRTS